MLVDSHCHLDYPDFATEGVGEIVNRAKSAGVRHFLTICTEISKFPQVLAIAKKFPFMVHNRYASHHAAEAGEINITKKDELIAFTKDPKVAGIGETGLDYLLRTFPARGTAARLCDPYRSSRRNQPAAYHS